MRPPRGPLRLARGLAGEVAASVRRRQQDREPRVVLYDAAGRARVLRAGEGGREEIIEAAERLLAAGRAG